MASNLFVCYSPSGEKFELSRPNFLDATQHFGFTSAAPTEKPLKASVKSPLEAAVKEPVSIKREVEDDEQPADEEPAFAPNDRDSVKAFLRKSEIEFDGRASLTDLVALANGDAAE